jgi:hypothetical protein
MRDVSLGLLEEIAFGCIGYTGVCFLLLIHYTLQFQSHSLLGYSDEFFCVPLQ